MNEQNPTSVNPLVSVVMIFLNGERFVEEAIQSVFAQTYERWELLLVDDGSTDRSTQISRRYSERHPNRVSYFEHAGHQNRGMSASRNLGIQNARGTFIAFLDSDDLWLPKRLEKQVALLNAYPEATMVYGPTMDWYGWTGRPEDAARDAVQMLGVEADQLLKPPLLLNVLLRNTDHSPRTCSVLLRREAVDRVGGFEASFRGLYEDQVFFSKLCLESTVYVTGECWDKYRKHSGGSCLTAVQQGEFESAREVFLDWLAQYMRKRRVRDEQIWKTVAEEHRPFEHPLRGKLYRLIRSSRNRCGQIAAVLRRALPLPLRARWFRWRHGADAIPPVGEALVGPLRRVTPISDHFGFDRGQPVDRYYIDQFLAAHSEDIGGRVLEMGDDSYTRKFGGSRVTKSDVLNVREGNPKATMIADLTRVNSLPSDTFDCVIFVQTLQFIYDTRAALRTLHRILKSGGVLLATFPGISQLSRDEWRGSWYWNFTRYSAQRSFAEVFPLEHVTLEAYGNVLSAVAFLHGLAVEELRREELDYRGPDHDVIIAVRAIKT